LPSSRSVGDELEKKISKVLGLKRTAMSGAYWDNADLANADLMVEAKVKNTQDNFRAPKKEISKLKAQAEKVGKDWLYIQQVSTGEVFVLTSLDILATIAEEYFEKRRTN
jgi:hypothetical protein